MKKKLLTTLFLTLLTAVLTATISVYAEEATATPTPTAGQNQSQSRSDLEKKIAEYEQKLGEVRSQKNTLSAQIEYMDTQLYIAELRINQTEVKITETEKEIDVLGARITNLDSSLDQLSETLLQRIVAGYKNRSANTLDILLDSTNVSKLVNRLKYYQLARDRNQKALLQVQEAKSNFEEQKDLREKKAQQLDELKVQLDNQKVELARQQDSKRKLLAETQNDEQTYQNLLNQAKAEYSAIQGIISGAGTETKIGEVKAGNKIASVIPGASCNSNGGHLHFIAKQNGSVVNPFNFLKSVDYQNCSGSSCGSDDGDSFNPSGNWEWPLNPLIKMSQGYGQTWAVRNTWVGRIYSFHNGIDINGSSNDVKAVADGTLYRGSYSVGCALPYVKLVHNESGQETYYLHVYSSQ